MELFARLCDHYRARPNRRGDVYVSCPACGKRAGNECSFSQRGWFCFVCGEGGSLHNLAKRIGLDGGEYTPPQPVEPQKQRRRYWWQDNPDATLRRLVFEPLVERVRAWQTYHPSITTEMVQRNQLGLGQLPLMEDRHGQYRPASKCIHKRLLVPLFGFDGQLVGVRGRAIECDCGKWLSPAGNKSALYNWQAVVPGALVMIVENAIDALLVTEMTDSIGVATLSISYWRDEWTDWLCGMRPLRVVIAYDNHWPGQGTNLADWKMTHSAIPVPRAFILRDTLVRAGLTADLFEWAADDPIGCDIGDIMR